MTPDQPSVETAVRERLRQPDAWLGMSAHEAACLIATIDAARAAARELSTELQATRNNRLISAIFGHHKGAPRPFALYRRQDVTGVSGTGVVATGAVFEDGVTVVRWFGVHPSTVIWPSLEDAAHVHLHGGKTQIVWLSDELEPLAEMEQERDRALKVIRHAYEAGDDAWRICADALHPTDPTRLAPKAGQFEDLLADPHEQFDPRAELLASVIEYTNAPSTAASTRPKNNSQAVTP